MVHPLYAQRGPARPEVREEQLDAAAQEELGAWDRDEVRGACGQFWTRRAH